MKHNTMNTENKHWVCKKQWNKWGNWARHVFNEAYESYDLIPWVRLDQSKKQSKAVAWNAAFIAACVVQDLISELKEDVFGK